MRYIFLRGVEPVLILLECCLASCCFASTEDWRFTRFVNCLRVDVEIAFASLPNVILFCCCPTVILPSTSRLHSELWRCWLGGMKGIQPKKMSGKVPIWSDVQMICEPWKKTAEPIEMVFGLRTRVGSVNHVLDGIQIRHGKRQFRGGRGIPL